MPGVFPAALVPSKDEELALQAVQKLHTNGLLPALNRLFTQSLGREVEVVIIEAHQRMFGLYIQSLGETCWNYCFKMDHLKGWAHLAFSLPLCAALLTPDADGEEVRKRVESIQTTPIGESWASDSDYGVIAKIIKVIAENMEEAWDIMREIEIHDIHLQIVPSFIYMDKPTDPAFHIKIEVRSEGYEDLTLDLCYLLSTLEPILPHLK